jgi:starch synthase (maltosyl-transferring)
MAVEIKPKRTTRPMDEPAIPLDEGRRRVVVDGLEPELEAGRFPIKRTVGETVLVEANVYGDGHDSLSCLLRYRHRDEESWHETPMEFLVNDRWRGSFRVERLGHYLYSVLGWIDHWKTWRKDFQKRIDAEQDVTVDLMIGAQLITDAAQRAPAPDRDTLYAWAEMLTGEAPMAERSARAMDTGLDTLVTRYPDRRFATSYERELGVEVDRERARFSSWYELFPRSAGEEPGRHGTFADVERRLPYVAELGFDVLYLPPIHPIGTTFRKGRNNTVGAEPGDVGSPWAIGSPEGGHTEIHPELGTLDDFRRLVRRAKDEYGLEVALDIAFNCSPDHPWVTQHPDWFKRRPDGTIQYSENPPKKYQDIYPINFESSDWRNLWVALRDVFLYWCEQGVHIFRVDNPHTKAFRFWEWCLAEVKQRYPEAIFLSEAFTRPKVRYHLAKVGFTQGYTYFAWRDSKWELIEYLTELTRTEVKDFFRPNFWPNTPDILTEFMQKGGRPAFMSRVVLAATLTASYGIYGPAYELAENRPAIPGKEEYLDSEKYQLRHWDINRPDSLRWLISRLNAARKAHVALQYNESLRFHQIDNDNIIAYTKASPDMREIILTVVNLDYTWTQSGWLELPLDTLDIDPQMPFQVHDLLTDARYLWQGRFNYVELNPHTLPAHVFRIRRPQPDGTFA